MEPTQPVQPVQSFPTTRNPLQRSRSDRMVAGVCGGAGRHLDIDPTLLRLALVLLTVFGAGIGVVLYVAAWILVPEDGRG